MPERPEVGAALPVFNGERHLAAALESILEQTHSVTDIVVVDDGSDDKSVAVALEFGPPVRVVRQPHSGVGDARTRAVTLVRGEVVVLLDADDLLTPRSVESRVEVLRARPEVDIVYGQIRCFTECTDGEPIPLDEPRPAHVAGAMLVRRSAFDRVGRFASGLRAAEGLDWLLRAHEIGLREATVDEQVQWRRVHEANTSRTQQIPLHEFPRVLKASLDRRREGGLTAMDTAKRWEARRAFAQEAALAEVVLAFANRGVRPLLIKGTATTRLLGLDPATRPSVDLDLLVAASAHPATAEVLAGLGYKDTLRGARPSEAARVHARVWTRGAPVHLSIDLHHSLAHVPDSETLFVALLRDAHTITLGPASVEVPGDGACALIVVLHAAHHVGMAKPLEDLRRAVRCLPESTWLDAAALAAELGAADSFAFGLRLVDEGALLADRIDARGEGTLRDQLRARAWEDGPLGIHRLRTAPTAGAAATVLRDALLPTPAFVRSSHPELGTSRTRLAVYYMRRWLRMPRALIRYARVRAPHVREH